MWSLNALSGWPTVFAGKAAKLHAAGHDHAQHPLPADAYGQPARLAVLEVIAGKAVPIWSLSPSEFAMLVSALAGALVGTLGGALLSWLLGKAGDTVVGVVGGLFLGAVGGIVLFAFVGRLLPVRFLSARVSEILLAAAIAGAILWTGGLR